MCPPLAVKWALPEHASCRQKVTSYLPSPESLTSASHTLLPDWSVSHALTLTCPVPMGSPLLLRVWRIRVRLPSLVIPMGNLVLIPTRPEWLGLQGSLSSTEPKLLIAVMMSAVCTLATTGGLVAKFSNALAERLSRFAQDCFKTALTEWSSTGE